jgi:hypothetical protein
MLCDLVSSLLRTLNRQLRTMFLLIPVIGLSPSPRSPVPPLAIPKTEKYVHLEKWVRGSRLLLAGAPAKTALCDPPGGSIGWGLP